MSAADLASRTLEEQNLGMRLMILELLQKAESLKAQLEERDAQLEERDAQLACEKRKVEFLIKEVEVWQGKYDKVLGELLETRSKLRKQ